MTEAISNTPFSNRCEILSELWMNYRNADGFKEFLEYNDLGLPLSYAIANGMAEPKDLATDLVNETFDLLLESLDVPDSNFDSLDQLLSVGLENDIE
jgi:hypothetical protein